MPPLRWAVDEDEADLKNALHSKERQQCRAILTQQKAATNFSRHLPGQIEAASRGSARRGY
jgi:hypothetical protein